MPRPRSSRRENLVDTAMTHFWRQGYEASSMDDLVTVTGVSRQGIYADAGSKRALYIAGFDTYRERIVDPAFGPVEAPGAGLAEIAAFLETQIVLAVETGLPGPGCLISNAMTETAPHDTEIATLVQAHIDRLRTGFAGALANEAPSMPDTDRMALAALLVTTVQGLWSMSRLADDPGPLRAQADALMTLLKTRMSRT